MDIIQNLAKSKLTPFKAALGVFIYKFILLRERETYRYSRLQNRILYRGFFNAYFRKRRSAFMTLLVPGEIFAALGIAPLIVESLGGVLGSLGLTERFLHTVAEAGLPESLCTFHRMHLAFALEGGFSSPRYTVAASALCDGNMRALQRLSEKTGSRFFFLDFPHPEQDGAVEYLAGQLKSTYLEMASDLGVSRPLERLKEAVFRSEEARKWINAVNEIRKTHYLPDNHRLIWLLTILTGFTGTREAIECFKTLYEELRNRGKPIPPEKKRLLLIHLLPLYPHPGFEMLFKRDVVIAVEEFTRIRWPRLEPEDPFRSIALKALSWPIMGSPDVRIRFLNRLIEEYSIDGVLFNSHWGCRHSDGAINAIKSHLKRPLLRLEMDLVDGNSSFSGQLMTRIESFLEMIGAS
ncbi:MAG: hypothetical protein DRP87_07320 [Spirochaetes bacterium]|nr:MAG: hypothetical protein DRP87_07320 [Spirochaetota bacterium]